MRRIFLTICVMFSSVALFAQKIAYIDTETILSQLPEYVLAQLQLNELSDKYRNAIETEVAQIDEMYRKYQAEKGSLSQAQRTAREDEIIAKERAAKEKQDIYFGEDGIMSDKSKELLDPIQQKVNKAIAKVAESGNYTLIIDIAATPGVVYKNESLDLTQKVISILK